jgi:ankyrin repeat protein
LLNDEQKQDLLESLKFEQIDARQMTIKTAHANTCRWLLNNSQYLDWLDTTKLIEHHGFLWIKGNAGTGKSTLMKFACTHARRELKGHIVLSFFFNARGEEIERTTSGTYRSLLLQLLEGFPALRNVFDSLGLSTTSSLGTNHQWTTESLKTLLEQAIQALGKYSVVCFIDALDECEQEQIREMVQFFEHIGDLAVSNSIRFQVCFSSRHYPHITIRNGLELVLDGHEGHTQDITTYVETELKIGKSKVAQQIRAELQERSSGIFMWVVLVVSILNKESDRGQVHTLQRKLQEIPSDLHELFRGILTRDIHNKDSLTLCIQWVLFANQPLSPEQLYHAILSGIDFEAVTEWDAEEITKDVVKRFILDSSKGLAEVTVSKTQRVQFIHQSVRDFLLKENGLSTIWPEFKSNFQGQSHDRLKQCCLDYININISAPLNIPSDLPKAFSQQAADLRMSVTQRYPFLEYAVHNVLHHADTAECGGISQAGFLDIFPHLHWIKLHNVLEEYEVCRHKDNVSLLYMLAEFNAAHLISIHPSASSCLDVEDERYGCAFLAANATGGQEAMQACIESLRIGRTVSVYSRRWPEGNSRQKRVKGSLGRDFKYSKKVGMPFYVAKIGCTAALSYLIGLESLDLDSKDAKGQRLLYTASTYGHKEIAVLLLEKGADANAQGGYYGNALQAASAYGYKEIAVLLLEKGADVNAQGGHYGNALQAALAKGYKEIAVLLLEKGADANAQGGYYSNALQAALVSDCKEIAVLLLRKGADVNTEGGSYGNALQAASAYGHKEIAALLLEKGADANAQGGYYGNALQAASAYGYEEITVLLLEKGANVNAQGGHYGNALQAALVNGRKEIAALLQKHA